MDDKRSYDAEPPVVQLPLEEPAVRPAREKRQLVPELPDDPWS